MTFWTIPRLWEGQTVAVMASGASMSMEVAEEVRASGLPAIAINDTARILAPWAAMVYAADAAWWSLHARAVPCFPGLKVTVDRRVDTRRPARVVPPFCRRKRPLPDTIMRLRQTGIVGFDTDPAFVRTGGNSGYQAVCVAAHAGAARILLCGFNMGGRRWHPDHAAPLRNPGDGVFVTWRRYFDGLAPELAKRGVEVINCTPDTSLNCFPVADLAETLATIAA